MVERHPLGTQPYPLPDLTRPQVPDGTAEAAKVIERD
jgi:hypothetical protein